MHTSSTAIAQHRIVAAMHLLQRAAAALQRRMSGRAVEPLPGLEVRDSDWFEWAEGGGEPQRMWFMQEQRREQRAERNSRQDLPRVWRTD